MKKLYEICYGIEPTEEELALLEIKFQRLKDNGYSEQNAQKILLDNKLSLDEFEYTDSIINTTEESIYYHYNLQIHSKPNSVDPVTLAVIKQPYYLEMKQRYTMNDLLDYYSSISADKICLVHGEQNSKIEFAKELQNAIELKGNRAKVVCVNRYTSINL